VASKSNGEFVIELNQATSASMKIAWFVIG
jgi:hypothetical protein